MRRAQVLESALGEIVVAHLRALGADVYEEVEVSGGVADIVARVGAEIWIVEIKTSLSLALVTQAMDRRRLCHRVLIAAPYTRHMREVGGLCREIGIGLWRVTIGAHSKAECSCSICHEQSGVREEVPSRRWNSRPVDLASKLRPEHQTHAKAGSVGAGGRWTPFRATCEHLARIVAGCPGITLKAAIVQTQHHYASAAGARSSLAKWIAERKVPGVEARNGALFPVELGGKSR